MQNRKDDEVERNEMDRRSNNWQLDRHIPISVIITLLFQTGMLVWWNSKLDSRVAAVEIQLQKEEQKATASSIPDRLTRLEVQQKFTYDAVNNILIELKSNRHNQ